MSQKSNVPNRPIADNEGSQLSGNLLYWDDFATLTRGSTLTRVIEDANMAETDVAFAARAILRRTYSDGVYAAHVTGEVTERMVIVRRGQVIVNTEFVAPLHEFLKHSRITKRIVEESIYAPTR